MSRLYYLVIAYILVIGADANACSIGQYNYDLRLDYPGAKPRGEVPVAPSDFSISVKRTADREFLTDGSCGSGKLTGFHTVSMLLQFKPEEYYSWVVANIVGQIGYQFEIKDIETGKVLRKFSKNPKVPHSMHDGYFTYTLSWTDLELKRRKPLKVLITAYAVDKWLRRSSPCLLRVTYPGASKDYLASREYSCEER